MSGDVTFWLVLGIMLIGLIGALLPGIPGVLLIWGAAMLYALSEGTSRLTPVVLVILTLLGVLGATADIWVSHSLGRMGGASGKALLAGMIFGFLGMAFGFVFGGIGAIPGAIIGTLGGIVLVEWRRRSEWRHAFGAGAGWLLGYLLSSLVEFGAGIVMVLVFVWRVGL